MRHLWLLAIIIPGSIILLWAGYHLDAYFDMVCELVLSYLSEEHRSLILTTLFTTGEHSLAAMFGLQILVCFTLLATLVQQSSSIASQTSTQRLQALLPFLSILSLMLTSFFFMGMVFNIGLIPSLIIVSAICAMNVTCLTSSLTSSVTQLKVKQEIPHAQHRAPARDGSQENKSTRNTTVSTMYGETVSSLNLINRLIESEKRKKAGLISKLHLTTQQFVIIGMMLPCTAIILIEPSMLHNHPIIEICAFSFILVCSLMCEAHAFQYTVLSTRKASFDIHQWIHWIPFLIVTAALAIGTISILGKSGFIPLSCMIPHLLFCAINHRKILVQERVKLLNKKRRQLKRDLRAMVKSHPELIPSSRS